MYMWIRSAWIVLLGARNACRTEQVSCEIGFAGGVGGLNLEKHGCLPIMCFLFAYQNTFTNFSVVWLFLKILNWKYRTSGKVEFEHVFLLNWFCCIIFCTFLAIQVEIDIVHCNLAVALLLIQTAYVRKVLGRNILISIWKLRYSIDYSKCSPSRSLRLYQCFAGTILLILWLLQLLVKIDRMVKQHVRKVKNATCIIIITLTQFFQTGRDKC